MKRLPWVMIAFLSILLLAISLRFFDLGIVPPGVNRDEAAIGYNAYSLLLTGKDEYGRFLPISFQSFGDWKLPVYIYETVLSVKLFGLNTIAVRLPSVLAGVVSVILAYFLVKEFFGKTHLALITMLLMAISPWSLHLSRAAYEANVAVCLVMTGVFILLKGIKKSNSLIILAALLLALTFGTYASNYVFTSLLAVGLFFLYRKELLKNRYGIFAIALFIMISGFLWFQTSSANTVKLSGISIFGDPSVVHASIEIPRNEHSNPQGIIPKLLHNRVIYGTEKFAQNYLNAFSPEFLFIRGGTNHSHNIMNFGNMYLVEALFFFLGIAFLLGQKKSKSHYLVLWWLLISPLAASLTKDAPHTVRMFAIFPLPSLLSAFGIMWFINSFKHRLLRLGVIVVVVILFCINIAIYFDSYYIHFPYKESQNWGILYEKLNTNLAQPEFKDKKVIMTGVEQSPYIYLLFYSKYDPRLYQEQAVRYPMTSEGFVHVKQYDRFTFRDIDWGQDINIPNTLLVTKTEDVPQDIRQRYKTTDILLPSNDPWFTIVQTTKD